MFLFKKIKETTEALIKPVKEDIEAKTAKKVIPAKPVAKAQPEKKAGGTEKPVQVSRTVQKPAKPARAVDKPVKPSPAIEIPEESTVKVTAVTDFPRSKPAKKAAATTQEGAIKVVIPASELEEETPEEKLADQVKEENPAVPDEVADSLLVKVNRENIDESKIEVPQLDLGVKTEKAETSQPVEAATEEVNEDKVTEPSETPGEVTEAESTESVGPQSEELTAEADQVAKEQAGEANPTESKTEKTGATGDKKPDVNSSETKAPETKNEGPKGPEVKGSEPKKPAAEGDDKGNLFSNLFGNVVEEEETPLDRLIKALPDITIEEVLNEAQEVKELMNEWFQNQDKSESMK